MRIQKHRTSSPERYMVLFYPDPTGFSAHLVKNHTTSLGALLLAVRKFHETGSRLNAMLARTALFASELRMSLVSTNSEQPELGNGSVEAGHD